MGCTNSNNDNSSAQPKPNLNSSSGSSGKNNYQSKNELGEVKRVSTAASTETLQVGASTFVNYIQTPLTDNYVILEKLGEGQFGLVHKAKHKATGESRACKKISKAQIDKDPASKAEMCAEIALLKSINHPNVMKTYEFYEDPKYIYIISELCQGGELFDYIVESGTISEPVSANIMSQLFTAISYMHNAGIIHRDLKPENLLLEEQSLDKGRLMLKVADFGTGALSHSSETLTEFRGTPWYVAPEVINRKYDARCDIWSAGIIMYTLLGGTPPFFNQGTQEQVFEEILTRPVAFPNRDWKNISVAARDLVKKLLEKDPNRRLSLADAMKHEWIQQYNTNELKSNTANSNSLNRLKDFNASNKLQQAVASLITAQLTSVGDTKELREAFLAMDENKDGKLSMEEVQNGYGKVFGQTVSEDEVEEIFRKADTDNSGFIDYDEFVTATMSKQRLFSVENLRAAFRLFDKDGSGTITANEIKEVIGANMAQDQVWADLLRQADADGNGEIDIDEFINLMKDV